MIRSGKRGMGLGKGYGERGWERFREGARGCDLDKSLGVIDGEFGVWEDKLLGKGGGHVKGMRDEISCNPRLECFRPITAPGGELVALRFYHKRECVPLMCVCCRRQSHCLCYGFFWILFCYIWLMIILIVSNCFILHLAP